MHHSWKLIKNAGNSETKITVWNKVLDYVWNNKDPITHGQTQY